MKDEFKPHILGMCETFLNKEKCKMNSRELDLDNLTKSIRMAMAFLRHTMGTVFLISKPRRLVFTS
jgi:hypothetical protein